ncbi:hypothetical protein ACQJBY_037529 [Aegilops geniculata]
MGVVHKGGVWWFLLLAGVLLAAAAAAAEQDDGAVATAVPEMEEADEARLRVDDQGNDSCDDKCQHHKVPARKKQCVDECHSREHHHPSRASCETKCSHWADPTRKEECVQWCMKYGLSLDVGGSNDVVDEHPHAQEEEVARRPCDRECQLSCQGKCQGWKDRSKHQECVRQCIRGGSNSVDDEHLRGWEAVAGAIIEVV